MISLYDEQFDKLAIVQQMYVSSRDSCFFLLFLLQSLITMVAKTVIRGTHKAKNVQR